LRRSLSFPGSIERRDLCIDVDAHDRGYLDRSIFRKAARIRRTAFAEHAVALAKEPGDLRLKQPQQRGEPAPGELAARLGCDPELLDQWNDLLRRVHPFAGDPTVRGEEMRRNTVAVDRKRRQMNEAALLRVPLARQRERRRALG